MRSFQLNTHSSHQKPAERLIFHPFMVVFVFLDRNQIPNSMLFPQCWAYPPFKFQYIETMKISVQMRYRVAAHNMEKRM